MLNSHCFIVEGPPGVSREQCIFCNGTLCGQQGNSLWATRKQRKNFQGNTGTRPPPPPLPSERLSFYALVNCYFRSLYIDWI